MRHSLSFIILDQDGVIFPHWDGLDHAIEQTITDIVHEALVEAGVEVDRDAAQRMINHSYHHHGLGTVQPTLDYGLDQIALQRAYHRRVLDMHVLPRMEAYLAEQQAFYARMRGLLAAAQGQGVRFGVLTHGDACWAQEIAAHIGIADLVPFRRGVDSYAMRLKSRDASLYADFLRDAGHAGPMESVMLIDDRHDNITFAANLGMRTAWVRSIAPGARSETGQAGSYASVLDALEGVVVETAPVTV